MKQISEAVKQWCSVKNLLKTPVSESIWNNNLQNSQESTCVGVYKEEDKFQEKSMKRMECLIFKHSKI